MNFPLARATRLAALLVLGALALVQRTNAQDQPPKFHTETNFVRVDVYPTVGGAPVRDLTANDFELLEDGQPQKIETFQHVNVIGPAVAGAGREPTSVAESRQVAETTQGRLFVIFLDTYFVDVTGSNRIRQPLVNLLNRLVGPDDLFAVMTPDMSAADITFARRTETVEGYLSRYWFWGQRDRLYPDDPVEQDYLECYRDSAGADIAKEMIQRRREKKVIDALGDLTLYLRGVREERKAVITITGGWVLFQPDPSLLRRSGRPPDIPRAGTTPDGRLTADAQPFNIGLLTKQKCDNDRLMLAELDDRTAFDTLIGSANRANVSFYPLNALGPRRHRQADGLRQRRQTPACRRSADRGHRRTQRQRQASSTAVRTSGSSSADRRTAHQPGREHRRPRRGEYERLRERGCAGLSTTCRRTTSSATTPPTAGWTASTGRSRSR